MSLTVITYWEPDGRWIAEVVPLRGVLAYGATRDEAIGRVKALALRVLADRIEAGERAPETEPLFNVAQEEWVDPRGRCVRHGQVTSFLRQDLFTVKLDDGTTITAVMPEELLSLWDPHDPPTRYRSLSVEVEMREAPALPRITKGHRSSLCGAG
jgi:predicted RNase H-like HicB family nuclease